MRLYIIRHAEPAYPDDALTPLGHRQAAALARRLAASGLDRLYSSSMARAIETARPTAALLGLPLGVLPWLCELEAWVIDQAPQGETPAWQVDAETVRGAVPPVGHDDWHTRAPLDAPGLADGFAELRRRSDGFLARHGLARDGAGYRREGPVGCGGPERVAVVCHAGLALTWLAHLLAIPLPLVWAGFSLPPCSVTTVDFEPAGPGRAVPRCLGLGDLSHLA